MLISVEEWWVSVEDRVRTRCGHRAAVTACRLLDFRRATLKRRQRVREAKFSPPGHAAPGITGVAPAPLHVARRRQLLPARAPPLRAASTPDDADDPWVEDQPTEDFDQTSPDDGDTVA